MWHYLALFFPVKIHGVVAFFILLVVTPWLIYHIAKFFFTGVIPTFYRCYKMFYKGMEEYLDELHMKEIDKEIAALRIKSESKQVGLAVATDEPDTAIPLKVKLVVLYYIFCATIILFALYTFIENH